MLGKFLKRPGVNSFFSKTPLRFYLHEHALQYFNLASESFCKYFNLTIDILNIAK